jgi:DNA helicase-4
MYISYKEKNITEKERKKNNNNYIKRNLIKEKQYFDNMFKYVDKNIELDENQRRIILTDEKYMMVIAGAGSGKTTTITAKVNYLIEKQKIKDEEIIIISFTNKAVDELKNRINKDFKHNVKVTTFHKLGYEIIKENTLNPPKIINDNKIIKEYIEKNPLKKKTNKIIEKILKILKKKKIIKIKNEDNKEFIKLCTQFISLYKSKSSNITFEKIIYKNKKLKNIKEYIEKLYKHYQEELNNNNMIDFDDLINKSIEIQKKERKTKIKYKYIIIDEYQDISENRYELIKNISKNSNTKIMVVGDDWQCIYSFASSNINLFTNFKNNVEYCEILKIEKTYRNSQQLIDIAGEFIQKNNNQIKKQLTSIKSLQNPITILQYKKNNYQKEIIKTLDYIIKKYGEEKNILILGRYTFDKNRIKNEKLQESNNIITYKKYPNVKIEFMTIHSSKGLGYDNVIIINAEATKLGFPSKLETEPILKPLVMEDKSIRYAEERRLFYVALTRTKNEVIILTPKNKKSEFVKEIELKCNKILEK